MQLTQNARMSEAGTAEVSDCETHVADFLDLMTDLKDVLSAENDFLRRGMPAALSKLNDDKMRLAHEYERSTQRILADHARDIIDDPELYRQVVAAGRELHDLTAENMQRLTAAMDATRSRIEAVMSAIRTHDDTNQSYGRGGQQRTSSVSFLRSQQAYQGRVGGSFKA